MNRTQKEAFVSDLNGRLQKASTLVVAHYRGLTVKQMTDLRRALRAQGGDVQVSKNTLASLAFKGTSFANVDSLMTGPTVLAFSADVVAAAKVAQEFAAKNDKFVILGGAMGTEKLDPKGIKTLATLPSLDSLRGKLIGLLQAPATKVAGVVQAPAGQLARVVSAKSKAA